MKCNLIFKYQPINQVPPAQEPEGQNLYRVNSLDDLRKNASTPETRIINSSGDGTNIGRHESNVGPKTSLISTIGILTQMFADQVDHEVMINNQQNNGTSSFGIGSDSTTPQIDQ